MLSGLISIIAARAVLNNTHPINLEEESSTSTSSEDEYEDEDEEDENEHLDEIKEALIEEGKDLYKRGLIKESDILSE